MQRDMQTFRNLTAADAKAAAELERQIFSDAWTEQSIADTIRQPQAFISAAEEDGELLAYCIVYYVMDEGEIARIAVSPHRQHQGIGQKLLDYTSARCLEQGVCRLLLDVRESNQNARNFYEKYGFTRDGVRRNFYEMPSEDAVLMSKTIG